MATQGSARKMSRVSADDMALLAQQLADIFKKYCAGEPQMSEAQFKEFVTGTGLADARLTEKEAGLIFHSVLLGKKKTINYDRFQEAVRKLSMKKEMTYQALIQTAAGEAVVVQDVPAEAAEAAAEEVAAPPAAPAAVAKPEAAAAAAPAPAAAAEEPLSAPPAVAVGAEFAGAGKENGLTAWRIENKIPVPVPSETLGKLYTGDSYIFLNTKIGTTGTAWDIHFWLGSESSQDEIGIAAYKTVELDESLGGGPVQYRECQGHESGQFMAMFKGGIEYLEGGVASGFVKVDRDAYDTRLLHLKGKRVVRTTKVPAETASLNTGDVFILDLGLQLFLYNGKDANRAEKRKGYEMIQKIKDDERGGKASVVFIDEDPDNAAFWEALGGKIEVTDAGADDAAAEKAAKESLELFRVSDASGAVEFTSISKGALERPMLDTNDVFVIDAVSEIFVWIGKGATAGEKKEGMMRAMEYLNKSGKPSWTPITRVVEDAESTVFKGNFPTWDVAKAVDFSAGGSSGVAKTAEQKEIDVSALARQRQADEAMVDDGSGKLKIWRIEDFKRVEVAEETYGEFFGGDSYVLLYSYKASATSSKEEHIIYFWQGRDSSQDEKGASALCAKELDDEMGGDPVQCRVVQGKEPAHFRQLFKGKMVVHKGGKASGFKNRTEGDSYDEDGVSLFHVKGTTSINTVAVQVEEEARNLNSGDCFVLLTPSTMYCWNGNASSEGERTTAAGVAELLKDNPPIKEGTVRDVVPVTEGEEPDEFWAAVGGKAEYAQMSEGEVAPAEPRLFQCTNMTGVFTCEEIFDFDQSDLIDDDVMLLDAFSTVYVWVGSTSNEKEKDMAMDTATKYVAGAADGRDPDTPIIRVNAGSEPGMFATHFVGWDPELFSKSKFEDPYEAKLRMLREEKDKALLEAAAAEKAAADAKAADEAAAREKADAAAATSFSLEELQSSIPDGVDAANKEMYLSDADFEELFGMSKDEWGKVPKWKRTNKKKTLKLF